jgi:hypothetical protein
MRMTLKELDYLKQCGGISARAAATIRDLAACAEAAEARVAELEREAQPDADAQKVAACKRAIEGVGWAWCERSPDAAIKPVSVWPSAGVDIGRSCGQRSAPATAADWREAAKHAVETAAAPYRERIEKAGFRILLRHGVDGLYAVLVQSTLTWCFGEVGGYATTEDLEAAAAWAEGEAARDAEHAADAAHVQVGHEVCPVAPDDDLLRVKIDRLEVYLDRIGVPCALRADCIESMVKGHEQYGEDLRQKDLTAETRSELEDALCYESQKEDPSVTVGRMICEAYNAL